MAAFTTDGFLAPAPAPAVSTVAARGLGLALALFAVGVVGAKVVRFAAVGVVDGSFGFVIKWPGFPGCLITTRFGGDRVLPIK